MWIADVRFPIVTGPIVTFLRSELAAWATLTVQARRPATMPKRLVTVRDDGGPDDGTKMSTRLGINVWADDPNDAENLARDAMRALRTLPGTGSFKATSGFSGPSEVDDEPAFTFDGETLTHFFFSLSAVVKGTT